jgi:hypothetical protein
MSKSRLPTHYNSGQVSAILNPTHGVRDEMRRAGIVPKNYQSANLRRIRALEASNRDKRSAAEGKSSDIWSPESKNQKYAHVTSAVARTLAQKPATPSPRPTSAPPRTPRTPRTPSNFVLGRVEDKVRERPAAPAAPRPPFPRGYCARAPSARDNRRNRALHCSCSPPTPRARRAACSRAQKPIFLSTPMAEVEVPKTRKPPVPRRDEVPATPRTPRPGSKDFISENIKRAAATPRPSTAGSPRPAGPFRSPEQAVAPAESKAHHSSYGALPKYLIERKLELALARECKARDEEERRLCPPGTRLLAESERLETLSKLREGNDEVTAALQKLPFVPHTFSQKKAKADLEAKAKSITHALTIFGRSKVVIQEDE